MPTVAIEPAASTVPAIRIMREGDRVWLEGVQGFGFHQKQSSSLGAQAEVLRVLGETISYEDLVGGSALAFRVQAYKKSMCPSAPHAMVGQSCGTDAFCPWSFRVIGFHQKPETPGYAERAAEGRAAVKASIDRGVPVIIVGEEDGLIIGYQKGGEEWICLHPLRDGGQKTYLETQLPWCVAIADKKRSGLPSRKETALAAIKQALAMWSADSEGYHIGEKAWQVWLERLEAASSSKDEADGMQQGNAWVYDTLVAYRKNAAGYLRKVAGDFPTSAAAHLHKAADLYEKMADQTLSAPDRRPTQIAPYPSKDSPWTQAQRDEQMKRMREALVLEKQALEELRLALRE